MDFLRPALLWGMLAVALPILIHLLGRRRVRVVPIATLRFLERARARASAHLRLRRLLLLLARMLALAAIALLYGGPGCTLRGAAEGPATWVLVLDNSPSMAAARRGRTRLQEAQQVLRRVIDGAGAGDRFLLLTTVGGERVPDPEFVADAAAMRQAVDAATVRFGRHAVDRVVETAIALARDAAGGRVLLVTDLQASGWTGGSLPQVAGVPVQVVDVGFPDPSNAWIAAAVESQNALQVALGAMGQAAGERRTVRMVDGGGEPVTLFVEGDAAVFQLREDAAGRSGRIEIDPGGDLGLDDVLPFAGRSRGRVRVLLVNGDPRGFEIRDELLFVRRALDSEARLGQAFEVREVRQGELLPGEIAAADVILLANPGPLPAALVRSLEERLVAGAGLIVTGGDRWTPDQEGYADLLRLLPAPIRDTVRVPAADPSRPPFEVLDVASFAGPMAGFRDPAAGDLSAARIREFWVFDPGADPAVSHWMALESGAPLLLERPIGRGRSLLFAATVDRDGADFCLQPGFVPWLEKILLHAAGRLRPRVEKWVLAGQPLALPYEESVTVEEPGGGRGFWQPGADPYVPDVLGAYRVLRGEEELDAFVARVPAEESDLARLSAAELDRRLGAGSYVLGDGTQPLQVSGAGTRRRDLSPLVAAVLLAALGLEAVLSARGMARRRWRPLLEEQA